MTEKQKNQFNDMLGSLLEISKGFCNPRELKKEAKEAGISYEEYMEMAYENIQELAKRTAKGIKVIK